MIRARTFWTNADHNLLLEMRAAGRGDREISIALQRTIPAIKGRVKYARNMAPDDAPMLRKPGRVPRSIANHDPVIQPHLDAQHVANCLREGGFIWREEIDGTVIEHRPRSAA